MFGGFSFKLLFVLSVLCPGVLLNLYPFIHEGTAVCECKSESLAFAEAEKKCVKDGETEYLASPLELEENEIEKTQAPFECLGRKVHGAMIGKVESTREYQNLKLQCELQECVKCDSLGQYRTIDGTCNNLLNGKWGSSETCLKRLFPAYYEGVSGFRRSVCGISLPNPRVLSLKIFKDADKLNPDVNTLFTHFSQFISHDIVDTPASTIDGQKMHCCSKSFRDHPQCASIQVPANDRYFPTNNVTCLGFVRTAKCRTCKIGKRDALNRVTSFLDLSTIYGSTKREAKELRKNDGTGKLWVQEKDAGDLLPINFRKGGVCGNLRKHEYCFLAGDRRVKQQTPLSSFHTIFVREHNRIAESLKEINPHWHDENIYQETRKIVIAEYQVILFKEVLPMMIGPDVMSSYNLALSNDWTVYNPLVDPSILQEFAFAAFRLHSLIPSIMTEIPIDGGKRKLLEFVLKSAEPIYHGEMEKLLQGMSMTATGLYDRYTTTQITDVILENNKNTAIDLLAVDIQRGRDGGIPPYVDVIYYLSGGTIDIQTFEDLTALFQLDDVQLLKSVYCHVRDIDYFVGKHLEKPRKDAVVWGSVAEILAMQFRNLKFGDRFYFEHFNNFNKAQLENLKEVTLSKILCDNTNLLFLPQNVMKLKSESNPEQLCDEIPNLNLKLWMMTPPDH